MLPTLLTMNGYFWGILHDVAAQRGWPRVKPLFFLLMVGGHLSGYWLFIRDRDRIEVPRPLQRAATGVAIFGALGMAYSIMVEIPFRKAWIDRGHTKELVTDGTYALARHPGVIWALVWMPAAAIATRSRSMLTWWAAVWFGDVLHVWFQDAYTLPRVFGDDYRRYQRTTPFLVPTRTSIRRFAASIARARGEEQRESTRTACEEP